MLPYVLLGAEPIAALMKSEGANAPSGPRDDELAGVSTVLRPLLAVGIVSLCIGFGLRFFGGDLLAASVLALLAAAMGASLLLDVWGRTRLAAVVYVIALIGSITVAALLDYGIQELSVFLYPIAIIFAAVFLPASGFIAVTVIVALAGTLITGVEIFGLVAPAPAETGWDDVVVFLLLILTTAVVSRITSVQLRNALRDARDKGASLAESERALETLVSSLPGMAFRRSGIEPYPLAFASEGIRNLCARDRDGETVGQLRQGYESFIPDDKLLALRQAISDAVASGRAYEVEYPLNLPWLEHPIWVSERGSLVTGTAADNGDIEGYAGDITAQRIASETEKEHSNALRRVYVDVLDAATSGKLRLENKTRLRQLLGDRIDAEMPLTGASQLGDSRSFVRAVLDENGIILRQSMNLALTAIGEGLTNALKHGGGGVMMIHREGARVQVLIADGGPGIDFSNLPRVTLQSGYSTTNSLGMGFTIMLDISDQLILSTDDTGTSLVLCFEIDLSATRG